MVTRPTRRAAPRLRTGISPEAVDLVDSVEITDAVIVGDLSARVASLVEVVGCRIEGAQLIGTHLTRCRLTDCVVTGCDLSGVVLDDCACTRVEFRGFRVSGIQAGGSKFRDVAFVDCTVDDANFRMTQWERAEFEGNRMVGADFYAAVLPGSRFSRCDLTGVQVSKCTLSGSRIEHSELKGLRGAEALAGITITSDEILAVAVALFAAMAIVVADEA